MKMMRLLVETFKLGSQKAVTFHDHPLAVGATGAILYYLKDHFHSALEHVQKPRLFNVSQFMTLDRQAQKSLELTASLSDRKDYGSLLSVIDRTLTAMIAYPSSLPPSLLRFVKFEDGRIPSET